MVLEKTLESPLDYKEAAKGNFLGVLELLCLLNLYAEYITRNAGLEEAQAGIRLPGEMSITYADDITLMAESKDESERGE